MLVRFKDGPLGVPGGPWALMGCPEAQWAFMSPQELVAQLEEATWA